ncbi:MAG: 50S ribosomal protein L24 [Patescibacteria group bacterium]
MKLKKGDNVIVIAGKSKGQTGKIGAVFNATGRVIVDGVNKTKRHVKPRSKTEKGTTVEKEAAMHASNVMLIDSKTSKPTRIGKKSVDGKNVRIAKKSGLEIK